MSTSLALDRPQQAPAVPATRPRVLYVVSLFPCWSETFIVREIHQLLRDGCDVRILSIRPPSEAMVQTDAQALLGRVIYPSKPVANALAVLGRLRVAPLREARILADLVAGLVRHPALLGKSLITWWRVNGMATAVREWNPTHIHAHFATYPSTAAMILSRRMGVPFSFTCHAHDIFLEDHLLATKLREARFSVGISRFNRQFLSARIGPDSVARMRIVHCGIDLDAFPYLPDGRDPRHILAVGRLDHIKGFGSLVEACALLARRGVEFTCEIVGTGPLEPELREAIARHGLADRVDLAGALKQEQVREKVRKAGIFAMPSVVTARGDRDGIPVALMEAMASGARAVSTRVSGIPELVEDGVTGLLAEPGDPASLAAALERLLVDAALGARLASHARQRIEREFDIATEARKLVAAVVETA